MADFWTDPTHTQPPLAALMAGEFLVITGEGAVYGEREASDRLTQTGRRAVEHKPLASQISVRRRSHTISEAHTPSRA